MNRLSNSLETFHSLVGASPICQSSIHCCLVSSHPVLMTAVSLVGLLGSDLLPVHSPLSNSALVLAPNSPASGRWRGYRVCLYSLACSSQVQCHPRGQRERTWRMTPHRTSTRLPVSGTGAHGHSEPCGPSTRQYEPGRMKLCNRASASLIRQLCKSLRRRGR